MICNILHGDCKQQLGGYPSGYFDSVVTDPPYGLKFMGKKWDHGIPDVAYWEEVLRVAKPGAYMLVFGGTRTHHRLMVAIEDAGWEIRDCLMWLYGSGFPKSLDVSKAIDKMQGAEREVVGEYTHPDGKHRNWRDHDLTKGVIRYGHKGGTSRDITAPATPESQQWDGWGTALKPPWEPIIMARKPLEGTVAANVLRWGTGGINIGGGRIGTELITIDGRRNGTGSCFLKDYISPEGYHGGSNQGRWPANLMLDEEAARLLDEQSGNTRPGHRPLSATTGGIWGNGKIPQLTDESNNGYGDSGGASRFFYCAKASPSERNAGLPEGMKNTHPTVKPVKLLRYLIKLITPPGGHILDPFMGSGSVLVAAKGEYAITGIDISEEYCEIARMRIAGGHCIA